MAESPWSQAAAVAGPSRSTSSSSFPDSTAPLAVKKKRGRFSDGNGQAKQPSATPPIPSIVNPPSPELVPRHSSSASSWGIEDLSDSDGDYDWSSNSFPAQPPPATADAAARYHDLDRDELAKLARPAKRLHVETSEDRHTFGKLAGLHIQSTPPPVATMSHDYAFGRPLAARSHSGVAAAFGLASPLPSSAAADPRAQASAPRVPPSSPTKLASAAALVDPSASTVYQQAVAPAPPTSPSLAQSASMAPHDASRPPHADRFEPLEDAHMRIRRGVASSFEVEPDRIVVTSLDDTSSSEDEASQPGSGSKTPEADGSARQPGSAASDFIINNELIEKLEAHSRAVLTGTSDRDGAQSTHRIGAAAASQPRQRRSGRRSAGGPPTASLGSLLSSRRRSTQSSPASSGYASPINADDVRGALILWKDPEQVLKATAAASPSPLRSTDPDTAFGSYAPTASGFLNQPPVAFESGQGFSAPGHAQFGLPSPPTSLESPLYAQQSSLSSSYFPEPSVLETRFGSAPSVQSPSGGAPESRWHHAAPGFESAAALNGQAFYGGAHHEPGQSLAHQHYDHHYGSPLPPHSAPAPHMSSVAGPEAGHAASAHEAAGFQRGHAAGAQPIDLSGCFGPSEEMDLDS